MHTMAERSVAEGPPEVATSVVRAALPAWCVATMCVRGHAVWNLCWVGTEDQVLVGVRAVI